MLVLLGAVVNAPATATATVSRADRQNFWNPSARNTAATSSRSRAVGAFDQRARGKLAGPVAPSGQSRVDKGPACVRLGGSSVWERWTTTDARKT